MQELNRPSASPAAYSRTKPAWRGFSGNFELLSVVSDAFAIAGSLAACHILMPSYLAAEQLASAVLTVFCTNIPVFPQADPSMEHDLALWGAGTGRTMRAHWMLLEFGLEYESHPIQPRTGETLSEEFVQLNPRHKIPILRRRPFDSRNSTRVRFTSAAPPP